MSAMCQRSVSIAFLQRYHSKAFGIAPVCVPIAKHSSTCFRTLSCLSLPHFISLSLTLSLPLYLNIYPLSFYTFSLSILAKNIIVPVCAEVPPYACGLYLAFPSLSPPLNHRAERKTHLFGCEMSNGNGCISNACVVISNDCVGISNGCGVVSNGCGKIRLLHSFFELTCMLYNCL